MDDREQPLVSVIIPVYNVEKYLGECIESVMNQTYKKLEIIIVNDGSPDNSVVIANEYAKMDKRITVLSQENRGVAAARNKGLDNATGEFVLFVDSDDWISEDHVSYLLMLQNVKNADMCFTTEFYTQKRDVQTKTEKIETISPAEAAALLLSPKVVVGTYDKLYRRQWLIDNHIRQNEKLFSGEGLNFIVTAAQHANFVTISNRKIYYYRRNVSESATTKFNIKMFTNNELSLDILEENKIVESPKFDQMLNLFRVHLMISGLLAVLTYSTPEQYPEEYKRWKRQIWLSGKKLLVASGIPFKSKIRILCANISPTIWAKLAKLKRDIIFKESV